MDYDEMIQGEDTDSKYHIWSEYREELTDYIIKSIEDYHIKQKLHNEGKKRLTQGYNIENILVNSDKKPTLAIWGAGGCNDIDVVRLSQFFKLVLIDHNVEKIKNSKKRFGLNDEDCLCVDMHFWDIRRDDYKLFEALLKDNADIKEICKFLEDVAAGEETLDYSKLPRFDYSVAVGIASQLNSRFAAILELYSGGEENAKYTSADLLYIGEKLAVLNDIATRHMLEAMEQTTKKLFVVGYEARNLFLNNEFDIDELIEDVNDKYEAYSLDEVYFDILNLDRIEVDIAGSKEFEHSLFEMVEDTESYNILSQRAMKWPFDFDKTYLMYLLAIERM